MSSFLKQIGEIWGRLKSGQRMMIVVAGVGFVALASALVYYGMQPDYGVLFSDMKPADAQTIIEKLKADGVKYQVTNGGTTVSVPQERVSELRLQMASSGLLSGGHVGFDLFDKTSFGSTDFTQQVNYQRAIEGELAKTIEDMDEVESARVHVTQPRESIYADKAERAKASVMVRVRQGRELSRERTEAITNLVSSAVGSLDPQDISVMDTQGRVLSSAERVGAGTGSGAFNSQIEARRKFEAETAARIVSLIEPISGPGHVRADVAADLDFSQVEQMEEKYDPKTQVIRSQQTTQEVRNAPQTSAPSVVGARANDPSLPPAAATTTTAPIASSSPSADQHTASTTNYEIDKLVRRTTGGSGRISRLSVSVLVDYKMVNGASVVRSSEELQKIQEVVGAAVGIDTNRGDQIVVQAMPFDQPAAAEARNLSFIEKNKDLIRSAIKYGLLALAALLLIIFVIRPARRALRLASARTEQLTDGYQSTRLALPAGRLISEDGDMRLSGDTGSPRTVAEIEAEMEATLMREMNAVPVEVVRAGAIKKQLVERARQNPETMAMTLRGWLQEKTP
jgi:flagellar M-ring protein FliF